MKIQRIAGVMALSGLATTPALAAGPLSLAQDAQFDFFNTTTGIGALSSNVNPTQPCWPYALSAKTAGSYYVSGCLNTATGFFALKQNTTGAQNVADGPLALYGNTIGINNTAVGALAMFTASSTRGSTAVGAAALFSASTSKHDTGLGAYALFYTTTGNNNTAVGQTSMYHNTTGTGNTAVGQATMYFSSIGSQNTAAGVASLQYNLAGNANVGLGAFTLYNNKTSASTSAPGPTDTSSSYNTAVGWSALYNNTTPSKAGYSTAVGYQALDGNAGVGNTALGANAGTAVHNGSYNTYIGYGAAGMTATDNLVTQIGAVAPAGASGTPTTYISGIYGTVLSGQAVVVTSTGQLGVQGVSSERFKADIAPMDDHTSRLWQLRPVTFRYKSDASGLPQYGLIAEEVARVYPELVVRDKDGRIDAVRYDELAPMLLNEMQKERSQMTATIDDQAARISALEHEVAELDGLKQALQAALGELKARDPTVARR